MARALMNQISIFDLFDLTESENEMTEQKLIKLQLKRGSGFVSGKQRILEAFASFGCTPQFAIFLKNEYGIGGYRCSKEDQDHDSMGIRMSWIDEQNPIKIVLSWSQVAREVADLIERGEYI